MAGPWDAEECHALIGELRALRADLQITSRRREARLLRVDPMHAASAANLLHYVALRQFDLRPLQQRLSRLGLSSLGRSETHVLASLDKVLGLLHLMVGLPWRARVDEEPVGGARGAERLELNAAALLGPPRAAHRVRIMVTLPSEAAHDGDLVDRWVAAGMDLARINCAHDDARTWHAMASQVRRAAHAAGRRVRVLMDLGGPKLRVGPIAAELPVLKVGPQRDRRGAMVRPARLHLRAVDSAPDIECDAAIDPGWLSGLRRGDRIETRDLRGKVRHFDVMRVDADGVELEGTKTAYLDTSCRLVRPDGGAAPLAELAPAPGRLRLERGDSLWLVADGPGRPAAGPRQPARLAITLPEALPALRKGHSVWFDDGRIGAVVTGRRAGAVMLQLTSVRAGGDWLAADKGVNLPDTSLDLPALTERDHADLETVVRCADLVGLSFAQSPADVRALRAALADRGGAVLGILLKIETRRGFECLPDLLLAAQEGPSAGVMIARGDLAVECGWERMAEVQEEILCACEAAHVPVVWATQVLETLARTGRPSRAEITDAAMGVRAECVMLNKGPYVEDAIRALDDILGRMQAHQSKKRPLLRALKSWQMELS